MSIDKITARILQEARDEAAATKQTAEEEAAALMAEAEKTAQTETRSKAAQAKEDAATLKERRSAVAELEARKLRLAAKQEMIAESFDMAQEKLLAMKNEDYLRFLLSRLAPYSEGEVILNAKDKKRVGNALAKKLSGTGLKVSAETADIEGGFILKTGLVSVNGSLENILETERRETTAQIAETLFA